MWRVALGTLLYDHSRSFVITKVRHRVQIRGSVVFLSWVRRFPVYPETVRKREMLSAGAAAGVSVAFGAPLGGVLFVLGAYSFIKHIFFQPIGSRSNSRQCSSLVTFHYVISDSCWTLYLLV